MKKLILLTLLGGGLLTSCSEFPNSSPNPQLPSDEKLVRQVESYLQTQSAADNESSNKAPDAADVYETQQLQFFQRLNAVAKGLIDPSHVIPLRHFLNSQCTSSTCGDPFKVETSELVPYYLSVTGRNLSDDSYNSAVAHSGTNMAHVNFARTALESFEVNGKVYETAVLFPFLDTDYSSKTGYAGWDGVSPQYITTSESFLSPTEMLVYRTDGVAMSMTVENVAKNPVWILTVPSMNGDGSELALRLNFFRHHCAVGTDSGWGCGPNHTGPWCLSGITIFGGRFTIAFGPGDAVCPPGGF